MDILINQLVKKNKKLIDMVGHLDSKLSGL